MFGLFRKKGAESEDVVVDPGVQDGLPPIDEKGKLVTLPVVACGAGLFSDGYINNVIGSVSTIFKRQYGDTWNNSQAKNVVSAIAFAGTVVGQVSSLHVV